MNASGVEVQIFAVEKVSCCCCCCCCCIYFSAYFSLFLLYCCEDYPSKCEPEFRINYAWSQWGHGRGGFPSRWRREVSLHSETVGLLVGVYVEAVYFSEGWNFGAAVWIRLRVSLPSLLLLVRVSEWAHVILSISNLAKLFLLLSNDILNLPLFYWLFIFCLSDCLSIFLCMSKISRVVVQLRPHNSQGSRWRPKSRGLLFPRLSFIW